MKRLVSFLFICLIIFPATGSAEDFMVLCYHGVEDQIVNDPYAMTVTTDNLIGHINWLHGQGWKAVSLDDIQAAKEGRKGLPEKAYLLTFDDGYRSVYERVFPILKAYKIPAVVAVVTSWLSVPAGGMVDYDGKNPVPRDYFMSWQQLREMVASGLVEIASHSHNLHRGVLANPQGNVQPAVNTRSWLAQEQRYETEQEWRSRIYADLQRSVKAIEEGLGRPPKTMVWPFGKYNQSALDIAAELGMTRTLTLDTVPNSVDNISAVARLLIAEDPKTADLVWQLQHRFDRPVRRVAHVDLDYVYDADPEQQHRNLSTLLDRIKALRINTVFLQAYADPDGDGAASELYFPNRHLPVKADLFSRAAWQLKTRADVEVFAWLPLLAFDIEEAALVLRSHPETGEAAVDSAAHRRLTPFSEQNRKLITEIYRDLAVHTNFDGVLFSDDGMLSDFEDASGEALGHYQNAWNLPASVVDIRQDQGMMAAWSNYKTAELINLSAELMRTVQQWRPRAESARNIFALPVLEPHSQSWFAQEFQAFVDAYDWVAVMAMPWMEGAKNPNDWLLGLVDRVKGYPGALRKTIFELQTVDWSQNNRKIPAEVTAEQMSLLLQNGAINFGYYPDLFIEGHPALKIIYPAISLSEYPYPQP
jgi:biofilm PGA synthesis lipoprotein PgaB